MTSIGRQGFLYAVWSVEWSVARWENAEKHLLVLHCQVVSDERAGYLDLFE